jgi:hypothetical protein
VFCADAIEGFEAVLRGALVVVLTGKEGMNGTFSSLFSRKLFPRMKT